MHCSVMGAAEQNFGTSFSPSLNPMEHKARWLCMFLPLAKHDIQKGGVSDVLTLTDTCLSAQYCAWHVGIKLMASTATLMMIL